MTKLTTIENNLTRNGKFENEKALIIKEDAFHGFRIKYYQKAVKYIAGLKQNRTTYTEINRNEVINLI